MKSSQCRLILHTVSALGPRSHGIASYCYTIDYRIQGLETVKITELIRISRFRKLCTLARALL